jgi:hypothetical protein
MLNISELDLIQEAVIDVYDKKRKSEFASSMPLDAIKGFHRSLDKIIDLLSQVEEEQEKRSEDASSS